MYYILRRQLICRRFAYLCCSMFTRKSNDHLYGILSARLFFLYTVTVSNRKQNSEERSNHERTAAAEHRQRVQHPIVFDL